MTPVALTTERLVLRRFTAEDADAVFTLLRDREVNTFLPWFPMETPKEAGAFLRDNLLSPGECGGTYCAVCLREHPGPVGYLHLSADDSHDFGYALRKEYWHRGIVTEAGAAFLEQVRKAGIPYITATHDVHNPRSGEVMKRLGMTYRYSYEEQWQSKNKQVVFRLYQRNFDGQDDRTYAKYWDIYPVHFIERIENSTASPPHER